MTLPADHRGMYPIIRRMGLDAARCDKPGCDCLDGPIHLHPQCHVGAGLALKYLRGQGVIEARCRTCGDHVASFEIK